MEPDFERAVREALADVNYDMAPVLARLSPEQRFAMIGDLADHARETSIARNCKLTPPYRWQMRAGARQRGCS